MHSSECLKLIYTYKPLIVKNENAIGDSEQIISQYQIVVFFSARGMVEQDLMKKIFTKMFPTNSHSHNFFFSNLDDLGDFALRVCQEVQAPEVFILSNDDFNNGFESCFDLRSFSELFFRFGTIIENSTNNKKRALFFWNK